ncbi:MAG: amidase, partial [Candidatus Dormibacteria bacterium]
MAGTPRPALEAGEAVWGGTAQLASQLRQRRLDAEELLDKCLERIARLNPRLRAFTVVLEDGARTQARESRQRLEQGCPRALEGVPLAIKDNRNVRGMPTGHGTLALSPAAAAADDNVVARLRAAGAVLVGKTSLPEFAALPVTETADGRRTSNPWDSERTAGGSSGGSAAAVAAGMLPSAEGNDGAGSLRIPGSCCGLFALKPTRGRISLAPLQGDGVGGFSADGFLTRRVADTALLLDVAAGPMPGDPSPLPRPAIPFSARLAFPAPRLRLAWTARPPIDVPVSPVCLEAVRRAAELCAQLGHEVLELGEAWPDLPVASDFRKVWAVGVRQAVLATAAAGGDPASVEPHNRELAELGRQVEAAELLQSLSRLQLFARQVAPWWQEHDLLLTPTLAHPPLRAGELFSGSDPRPLAIFDRCDRFSPFTPLANVAGLPAAQLPLHWHKGVPVGVQ